MFLMLCTDRLELKSFIVNVDPMDPSSVAVVSDHNSASFNEDDATTEDTDIATIPSNASADDDNPSGVTVKIPYPAYIASLYKSGTTSLHRYFQCGKQRSVHHDVARDVYGNLKQARDPFAELYPEQFDIFSDLSHFRKGMCFEPSTAMQLESLYQYHPNMTLILAVRNSTAWVESVKKFWDLGNLIKSTCQRPGYFTRWPRDRNNRTDNDLQEMYEWQVGYVRQFANDHPSITYIEIQLEDLGNGEILEDHIGISASCWGHSNKAKQKKGKNKKPQL